MNGMSVPRSDETLLDLTAVRHVRWKGEGEIQAGAGLSVWELDRYVRQSGWKLPVVNDGAAEASSIGGFLAAGGIGEGTVFYGGFWETVSSAALVTGSGDVRHVGKQDALFRWLFGSMGTLGVVYEATLRLVPAGGAPLAPVPEVASLAKSGAASWPRHLWLTLFVREGRREEAIARLKALVETHPGAWRPRHMYEYYLPHRRFNPPLLLGEDGDFIAIGIWGDRIGPDSELSGYLALEGDFQTLTEQTGFRRYFQTELIRTSRTLASYVGTACAADYRAIKDACDPGNLLNDMRTATP